MHSYVVALGSNMRHHCFGAPRAILTAAVQAMEAAGLRIERIAPVVNSAPLGPSRRRYANSAVLISTTLAPPASRLASRSATSAAARKTALARSAHALSSRARLIGTRMAGCAASF